MRIEVITTVNDWSNENAGIGDGLVAIPMLHGLQKKYPDAEIVFKLRPHQFALNAMLWPRCMIENKTATGERFQSTADLRIRTSNSLFWAEADNLSRLKGTTRLGLMCQNNDVEPCFDFQPNIAPALLESHFKEIQRFFTDRGDSPIILLAPGSTQRVRTWPFANFLWLAVELKTRGYRIAFIGEVPRDMELPLLKMGFLCFRVLPETKLTAFIQSAELIVGNDSGLTHFAGLLKRRALALCSSSDGQVVFGSYRSIKVLQAPRSCTGCLLQASRGYLPVCHEACRALLELSIDDVLRETLALL